MSIVKKIWWLGGEARDTATTNAQGQQAFLVIGDSIFDGTANGFGQPEPTAGTVYGTYDGNTISQITTDDVNAIRGYAPGAVGSCWPSAGIEYYNSTGYKPVYILRAIGNSSFYPDASATGGNWLPANSNYQNARTAANNTLTTLGITKLKAIYVNLGVNDAQYSATIANIYSGIGLFVDGLIADFPDTPILLTIPGRMFGSRDSQKLHGIREQLKIEANSNTNVYVGCSMTSYEGNGLLFDNIHPTLAGYTERGKQINRWQQNSSYNKFARAIISSHFDDLSTARKTAINTFIDTIGVTDYMYLDCLIRCKTTIDDNVLVDYALFSNTRNNGLSVFTANDSINVDRTGKTYLSTGFVPSFGLKTIVGASLCGARVKSNAVAGGTLAYLYGTYDGTRRTNFSQGASNQITTFLNGRNTEWTSGEGADSAIQANTDYVTMENGTTCYIYKNNTQVDSGTAVTGSGLSTREVYLGGNNENGTTDTNNFDGDILWFFSGYYLIDRTRLVNALNALDSAW